jgi:hypothetical protein
MAIGDRCRSLYPAQLEVGEGRTFQVHAERKCNPSGFALSSKVYYRFSSSVEKPLADGWVTCKHPTQKGTTCDKEPLDSEGFYTDKMSLLSWGILSLVSYSRPLSGGSANWFELVGTTDEGASYFSIYRLAQTRQEYLPAESGELFALVNDFPDMYCNNKGILNVTVTGVRKLAE